MTVDTPVHNCKCVSCVWEGLFRKGHSHRLIIISAFGTQRDEAGRSMGSTLTAIIVARPHRVCPFKPGSINIYEQASVPPSHRVAEDIVCGFFGFF